MCQLSTFLYILRWFFSLVITQWPIFQPTRLAFKPRGKASERSAFMRGSVSIFVICLLVKDRRQWLSIGLCCGNKQCVVITKIFAVRNCEDFELKWNNTSEEYCKEERLTWQLENEEGEAQGGWVLLAFLFYCNKSLLLSRAEYWNNL